MSAYEYYHKWDLRNKGLEQTLEHYLMRGFAPGGFTTAVLAGDLFGAVSHADNWNKHAIVEIAQAVVTACPITAYGSYEAVEAWLRDEDSRRSKYVTWRMLQGPVKVHNEDEAPF